MLHSFLTNYWMQIVDGFSSILSCWEKDTGSKEKDEMKGNQKLVYGLGMRGLFCARLVLIFVT